MFGSSNFSRRRFKPLKVLFFIMVAIAMIAVMGWVVMFLWNAILPDTVGVNPLTYWKAVGLLILAKILFGGFGRGRRSGGRWNGKKERWKNKWMNMSREERLEAKSRWKEHCKRRSNPAKGEEE